MERDIDGLSTYVAFNIRGSSSSGPPPPSVQMSGGKELSGIELDGVMIGKDCTPISCVRWSERARESTGDW